MRETARKAAPPRRPRQPDPAGADRGEEDKPREKGQGVAGVDPRVYLLDDQGGSQGDQEEPQPGEAAVPVPPAVAAVPNVPIGARLRAARAGVRIHRQPPSLAAVATIGPA